MTTPRQGFHLLAELYADPRMSAIWSCESTVESWLEVEAQLALAEADVGLLSTEDAVAIADACRPEGVDVARLWESARVVGYPILGLVRQVASSLPDGPSGRVHYGATTQDIMDSGLALQLSASCAHLRSQLVSLGQVLSELVRTHRSTPIAARTHGQIAVPTTFGAKLAIYLDQVADAVAAITRVRDEVAVVSFFGAGGTSAAVFPHGPAIRRRLAERLGLRPTDLPGHVTRGRIARYGFECALTATTCARLAREVVDLSRIEIGEVSEMQAPHRGASSTMPQKSNPVTSETIIGYAIAAQQEGTALLRAVEAGHERSAGEWQAEWLLLPRVSVSAASCVQLAVTLISTLEVRPARMEENLRRHDGFAMSEAIMMRLAPSVGRERAHDLVYEAVRRAQRSRSDLIVECRGLAAELAVGIDLDDLEPTDYLGEAPGVCDESLARWSAVTAS